MLRRDDETSPSFWAVRDSAARLLEVLAGDVPVSVRDMQRRGIRQPGQALYELELAGQRVERVFGRGVNGRRVLLGYRIRGAAARR